MFGLDAEPDQELSFRLDAEPEPELAFHFAPAPSLCQPLLDAEPEPHVDELELADAEPEPHVAELDAPFFSSAVQHCCGWLHCVLAPRWPLPHLPL